MQTLKNFISPDIHLSQLNSLLRHSHTVVLGGFFLGFTNVAVFWKVLDQSWLVIWLMVLLAVMLFRMGLAFKYKHANKNQINCSLWHKGFVLSSLMQGLCWFTLGLYGVLNLAAEYMAILCVSIAGLIGGSIATTSSSVQAFVAFSAPSLLPIMFMMFYADQSAARVLGLLGVVYFSLMVRAAFDINSILLRNIRNNQALQVAKKKAEELASELYQLSTQDALTQVANRRGFDETLEKEWNRASRNNLGLSLLMLDIDYFKKFNDFYGHLKGDEALKKVAGILKQQAARSSDYVARYGGEEFAIILPDTPAKDALVLAEKICKAVTLNGIEHQASQISNFLTISVGMAHVHAEQSSKPLELVKLADEALYKAKDNGRNCAQG